MLYHWSRSGYVRFTRQDQISMELEQLTDDLTRRFRSPCSRLYRSGRSYRREACSLSHPKVLAAQIAKPQKRRLSISFRVFGAAGFAKSLVYMNTTREVNPLEAVIGRL